MTDTARAIIDSDDPIPLAALLDAARDNGATNLPRLPTLAAGRVWPAGDQWIAETGEAPDTHTLDQLYPEQEQARAAARDVIEAQRDRLAERLHAAGGVAAELAETRSRWEPPTLYVWDKAEQRQPHAHTPA